MYATVAGITEEEDSMTTRLQKLMTIERLKAELEAIGDVGDDIGKANARQSLNLRIYDLRQEVS